MMNLFTQSEIQYDLSFLSRRWFLLFAGVLLFALADMRGGAGFLAWFVMIPFLLFVLKYRGWKNAGWLFFATQIAAHLSVLKIITPPLPYIMVSLFAVPTGAGLWLLFVVWGVMQKRVGAHVGIGAFVSLVVLLEWIQSNISEMGVWGTLAHTQLHNLPLLQMASLSGFLGISAIIAWGGSLGSVILFYGSFRRFAVHAILFFFVLSTFQVYGSIRLLGSQEGPMVRVAAVSTDLMVGNPFPEPNSPEVNRATKDLFARSLSAASQGAKFVVWNEGATIISREAESAFQKQAIEFALSAGVHLLAAYVVPVSNEPLQFENKYIWIKPDGDIGEKYFKHHPVPGEGSIRGTNVLRSVDTEYGPMAGAICYDYDFPRMALDHAALRAGVVFVPSSDWKGIDPQHTLMTRVRAIEGGFSLLRSVRAATSVGFDAYGRIRGALPYFEENDRILIVSLPAGRIDTLYSRTGDLIQYAAIGFLFYTGFLVFFNRTRESSKN